MSTNSKKHFLLLNSEKIDAKSKKAKNINTDKCERKADRAFKNFLIALGKENDTDYWFYDEVTLDDCLAKFWFGARKNICEDSPSDTEEVPNDDPEMKSRLYSANTMKSFWYGLNRILKTKGHLYDIIDKKTASFSKSQKTFNDALKELKSEGKAEIHSYPEIEETDQVKMYNHELLDPDNSVQSLQNKVQFDVRFYFTRRGCENMEKMLKDTFDLQFDHKNDMSYIIKKRDELTKNHKDIEATESGIMPENPDDKMCPVRSYKKYIEHLNPNNKFLWQKPLSKIHNPNIWFGLEHLGKNTLGKFMTDLSDKCKLSKIYTDHSIRVTGITVLTRMNFSASEIMSVSGHKSVQSLTNYQCTQPKQKVQMGNVLHQSLTKEESEIVVPGRNQIEYSKCRAIENSSVAPCTVALQNGPNINTENAVIPFETNFEDNIQDLDLMAMLNEFEARNTTEKSVNNSIQVAVMSTNTTLNNIPKSMFSNCNIQNITFNFGK